LQAGDLGNLTEFGLQFPRRPIVPGNFSIQPFDSYHQLFNRLCQGRINEQRWQ